MTKIVFKVDNRTIAYIMQSRGIRDFGAVREDWNRLFRNIYNEKDRSLVKEIQCARMGNK